MNETKFKNRTNRTVGYTVQPPKIEVISCIANVNQTETVLEAGADAIYAGLKNRSWYDDSIELSWNDLMSAASIIHKHRKKLYIAVNRDLSCEDIDEIISNIHWFKDKIFDGLILSDWGAIRAVRSLSEDIEIHLSANTACVNDSDFELAKQAGVQRVVLSPTFSLAEMEDIIRKYDCFEWEAITYGSKCTSEVSHCLCQVTSNGKTYNSICYYKYLFCGAEIAERPPKSFGMPNVDVGMANVLQKTGIYHWKIEGRARGLDHILRGTRTLRKIADNMMRSIN